MKRQRVYRFLVVLMLINPVTIYSQQQIPRIGQNSPHLLSFPENILTNDAHSKLGFRKIATLPPSLTGHGNLILSPKNFNPCFSVVSNHYSPQLGFFCRKEIQFEKQTSIPLRLRLGSLEYVNTMEGKK